MKMPTISLSRTFIHCSAALALMTSHACKSTAERSASAGKPPATKPPFFSDTFPDVKDMPKLDSAVLKSSDSREVMKMAQAYAASEQAAEQAVLQDAFRDPLFYSRLDDAEALKAPATTWRLASVLQVLRTNPSPAVHATILSLCDNPAFGADSGRTGLLVQVLVPIRPSPPKAIEFWRKHGAIGELHQHRVPHALADNGSPPAIALLEEHFLQPDRPEEDKLRWMRDGVLRHRFELPMIQSAERLIRTLPTPLAVSLTEVYFIYNERWYLSCDPPKPQPLVEASHEARRHYLAIAEYALQSLPLSDVLREQIDATRSVLREEQKHFVND